MNLDVLQMGFKIWLENNGKTDKSAVETNSGINISNAGDFINFLNEELSADSDKITSKSVSEILKMEMKDDKLVGAQELADYEKAIEDAKHGRDNSENLDLDETHSDLFKDIFNELMKDEKFKKAIDTDGSGKISNEEFKNFIGQIKGIDKNAENISVEDLLTAAAQIKNGVFSVAKKEADLSEKDKKSIKNDMKDRPAANPSSIPSRSSFGGATAPAGGYYGGANTYNQSRTLKQAENMSESELQAELTKAKGELSDKQNTLSSVIDGSAPEIKALNEAVNTTYEAYQTKLKEVDETMAKQVDELKQKIDAKQEEINNKDKEISAKESDISSAESNYNNAKSSRENLESVLSELQSSNSKENDNSAKISEVQSQLEAAKQAEETAKQAVETAKKDLEKLKEERKELESGDGGLNKLKEEMTKLEADIAAKKPEVKQLQDEWDKAKENLETGKAEATQKAQGEVKTAQEKVDKIETELTELKNNEVQSKYNNQYNGSTGGQIAQAAYNVPGTVGRCLSGVADTLDSVYGAGAFPPIMSAYEAADYLAANTGIGAHFREVQVERSELPNLPAGAVVVWDNNANGGGSNVSDAGRVHGHISIALGNGMESSDHIQEQIVDRDATFRVFYPIS